MRAFEEFPAEVSLALDGEFDALPTDCGTVAGSSAQPSAGHGPAEVPMRKELSLSDCLMTIDVTGCTFSI